MNRRDFLRQAGAGAFGTVAWPGAPGVAQAPAGARFVDVTQQAGIAFRHQTGAYGGKLLPETMGAGCAFFDYDADGWPDILLVNGTSWPGRPAAPSTLRLYHNNRNGTFTDVTRRAGLDIALYGMGVAAADFDNDGFPDLFISCVGQSRLFRNTGKGTFVDVTRASGLGGRTAFSTSAMWFDFDRDGLLDLFVCNYVRWSAEHDVFCSVDGATKSYCTPEAYRGDTCWLFRNLGGGRFQDVTAESGIFDTSSKSLGVTMIDDDAQGWPDVLVANDTQPNRYYRNQRNGTFLEQGVKAGVAFSAEGRARAGMGIDAVDFDHSGRSGVAITNFDREMIGLYRSPQPGLYEDVAMRAGVAEPSRNRLGFGCLFADVDLDGWPDLVVANGHIDEVVRRSGSGVGHAQAPLLLLNRGDGTFRDAGAEAGADFSRPRVGRGLAAADFDRDGDVDLLMTTNGGAPVLFRNDAPAGRRSVRFTLQGTMSNRDAIGAIVRIEHGGTSQTRLVKTASSYLSQSELPLTFGVGARDVLDRVTVTWPLGRVEEFRRVATGRGYRCVEGRGMS